MTVGVLALQGAFLEHEQVLKRLEIDFFEIRNLEDMNKAFDGLILPGGESTAMSKLLIELNLLEPLKERIMEGLPVLGTCAGLILLAQEVSNQQVLNLSTMPIRVKRNAYGRQLGSFVTEEIFHEKNRIPMVFIRAPFITEVGEGVKILAKVEENIVAAEYQNQIVTSFHPELTDQNIVHEYFIEKVKNYIKTKDNIVKNCL